jgi:hypothetical protein
MSRKRKANTSIETETEYSRPSKSQELYTKKVFSLDDLISLEARRAFTKIYKIQTEFPENKFITARDWWEPSSPTTQCGNVIGKWNNNTLCYICGLKLIDDNVKEFPPECEHILPVYQGALLLELYKAAVDKKNISPEHNLEYAWSHRCCNQIKSDTSFLTTKRKGKDEVFALHYNNTKNILNTIYKGDYSYCPILKNKINKINKNAWINERTISIGDNQINPIIEYLSQSLNQSKGLFYLGILSNILKSVDQNTLYKAQGMEQPLPPLDMLQTRIITYTEIGQVLINLIVSNANTIVDSNYLLKAMFNDNIEVKNIQQLSGVVPEALMNRLNNPSQTTNVFTERMIYQDVFMYSTTNGIDERKSDSLGKMSMDYALLRLVFTNMINIESTGTASRSQIKLLQNGINILKQEIQKKENDIQTFLNENELNNEIATFIKEYTDRTIDPNITIENTNLTHNNLLSYRLEFAEKYGLKDELRDAPIEETINLYEVSALQKLLNIIDDVNNANEDEKESAIEELMKLYESEKEELEEEKEMMTPQQQAYLDDVIDAANVLIALKGTKMTVVEPTEEEVEAATGLLGLKDAIQEENKTNETETLKKGFADLFNISSAFRSIPRRTAVPSRMTPLRGQGKLRKTKKRMTKRKTNKKNKRRTRRQRKK